MRKITSQAVTAFLDRRMFRGSNTTTDGDTLLLHGNAIAKWLPDGGLALSLAGWPTVTTRERLNGICRRLGLPAFSSRRKRPMYGDREIDPSEWIEVALPIQENEATTDQVEFYANSNGGTP